MPTVEDIRTEGASKVLEEVVAVVVAEEEVRGPVQPRTLDQVVVAEGGEEEEEEDIIKEKGPVEGVSCRGEAGQEGCEVVVDRSPSAWVVLGRVVLREEELNTTKCCVGNCWPRGGVPNSPAATYSSPWLLRFLSKPYRTTAMHHACPLSCTSYPSKFHASFCPHFLIYLFFYLPTYLPTYFALVGAKDFFVRENPDRFGNFLLQAEVVFFF